MATYTPVPHTVPSEQRTALITNVAAGDRIDITAVLGRPARGLQIHTTAPTDVVTYKLNSLIKHKIKPKHDGLSLAIRAYSAEKIVEVWSGADAFPTISSEGEVIETAEGLLISSIAIESVTLDTGNVVSIVVW